MRLTNKIGVIVDSFNAGVQVGLEKSKDVGAEGVQIYAVDGEMDPDCLSATDRRRLKEYIESLGLEISALCGDLGGYGFQDENENAQKVEKSKKILDLAVDLGTNIVTTHIGVVPQDTEGKIYQTMLQACDELSSYASSINAHFAIETGPEPAAHLKRFLDQLSTNGLSVNFDPANMVMVTGDDPIQGVRILKDYIVHTHVKDGVRLMKVDPREVYGSMGYQKMSHERIAELGSGKLFEELPLGEGHVDFNRYFKVLQDIGYTGFLTIEREVGGQPEADIQKAVEFIKAYR